jgi:hypothetical protein
MTASTLEGRLCSQCFSARALPPSGCVHPQFSRDKVVAICLTDEALATLILLPAGYSPVGMG